MRRSRQSWLDRLTPRRWPFALVACFLAVIPVNDPATAYNFAAQLLGAGAPDSTNPFQDDDDESEAGNAKEFVSSPQRLERRRLTSGADAARHCVAPHPFAGTRLAAALLPPGAEDRPAYCLGAGAFLRC